MRPYFQYVSPCPARCTKLTLHPDQYVNPIALNAITWKYYVSLALTSHARHDLDDIIRSFTAAGSSSSSHTSTYSSLRPKDCLSKRLPPSSTAQTPKCTTPEQPPLAPSNPRHPATRRRMTLSRRPEFRDTSSLLCSLGLLAAMYISRNSTTIVPLIAEPAFFPVSVCCGLSTCDTNACKR